MREFWSDTSSHVLDVYAAGPLHLLGRRHEVVMGMNGSTYRDEGGGSGYPDGLSINVHTFNPTTLGPVPAGGEPYSWDQTTRNLGLYGVARWNLADSLKLITGARLSSYQVKDGETGEVDPKKNGVITPYAGLVYDINTQVSAYASYSSIFNPQSNKNADGKVLNPVVGANYELGIKGELLDKRLNVSAALFRLEQTNLAEEDFSVPYDPTNVCGGTCYTAAGKVVSQGVDFGLSGQVTPNLNLAAGYTYLHAKYAAGPNKGDRYGTEQPQHSLRLTANYHLPNTAWSVGGNLAATSKTYLSGGAGANAWASRNSAMVLLGLNARYQISPKTQLLLAVSNLTDRNYRHLQWRNYSPFGEPRRFLVNLKHEF